MYQMQIVDQIAPVPGPSHRHGHNDDAGDPGDRERRRADSQTAAKLARRPGERHRF